MVDKRISALPGALPASSSDLIPTSQGSNGVNTGVTRKMTFAGMAQGIGVGINVRAYGAVGDGVTDDTVAIQAALNAITTSGGIVIIPPGTYKITATLLAKSNTTIEGPGTIKAASPADWLGSTFRGISNVNYEAAVITDTNIILRNLTIDYTDMGSNGGLGHCIYFRYVGRVIVENCLTISGASSCALLGCNDTLELGNTYLNFVNCGSDHWTGPKNAKVIGCHIETTIASQMVNFNPEPSDLLGTGWIADGFVMTGCIIVSSENPATPCQIEPLLVGNTVKNVAITGNVFKNSWLVTRGDVRGVVIADNTFSDFQGTAGAIAANTNLGNTPYGVIITGNVVRDCLAASPSVAVIYCNSANALITNNAIMGSGYSVGALSVGTTDGFVFANYVETTPSIGKFQGGFRFLNGPTNYIAWTDTSGSNPKFFLQTDNNWILASTDASGAQRNVFSITARSSASECKFSVPLWFSGTYTRSTPAVVAAAGTTIAGGTALTADINNVSSCTAGVADGVVLQPVDGQRQTVINTSADTLKVYPNNSGSAQIDAGGASVPTTILAGKSKMFTRIASGDFRTIATTE